MVVLKSSLFFLLLTSVLSAGPRIGPFLEPETPFLNSALLIEESGRTNKVRRGVLIPLDGRRWACFDTDLLRWAAFWQAPEGKPPLTLDSMAAISYPKGKTKAKSVPRLQGDLFISSPEAPGEGGMGSKREPLHSGGEGGVGPLSLERGRWLGIEMRGETPVLRYQLRDALIEEFLPRDGTSNLRRVLRISPHSQVLNLRIHRPFSHHHGLGVIQPNGSLTLQPAINTTTIVLATKSAASIPFPKAQPAKPTFPNTITVTNPPAKTQGLYRVGMLAMPAGSRFIRPTDLAFLSDGTGLLSTLDGDVWRIETPESPTSRWTRVASGLYETISLETTPDDRIFTLGRDQITELIDNNADGHIDHYRNASNVFLQTLQTRDYATSLAIDKDGSFLIAKGGINKINARKDNELSAHRGTILRIPADGNSATVLANGLRLPYVGLRQDGSVFASDQQGHYVPSTPIHLIADDNPYLGFLPTRQRRMEVKEPLFWYPHQSNRSAAAFAQWDKLFLQISWAGRLFAIETPPKGQAFSWQLPLQLDFPTLNATRHPISGKLYAVGLGISGYKPTTSKLSGIASIEEIKPFPKVTIFDVQSDQISITFDRALKEDEILLPASPALRLFNISRTPQYGSGHYLWDGKPGENRLQPTAFKISDDRRVFTLDFQKFSRFDILALHLTLTSGASTIPLKFFSRPAHLPVPDSERIAAIKREKIALRLGDSVKGKPLFTLYACSGCHSLDGARLVGPTLKGIGSRADVKTLRQSILEPNAIITKGFEAGMPPYGGVLTDQQLADLLAYLKTLR